jgi:hypothetical protein
MSFLYFQNEQIFVYFLDLEEGVYVADQSFHSWFRVLFDELQILDFEFDFGFAF